MHNITHKILSLHFQFEGIGTGYSSQDVKQYEEQSHMQEFWIPNQRVVEDVLNHDYGIIKIQNAIKRKLPTFNSPGCSVTLNSKAYELSTDQDAQTIIEKIQKAAPSIGSVNLTGKHRFAIAPALEKVFQLKSLKTCVLESTEYLSSLVALNTYANESLETLRIPLSGLDLGPDRTYDNWEEAACRCRQQFPRLTTLILDNHCDLIEIAEMISLKQAYKRQGITVTFQKTDKAVSFLDRLHNNQKLGDLCELLPLEKVLRKVGALDVYADEIATLYDSPETDEQKRACLKRYFDSARIEDLSKSLIKKLIDREGFIEDSFGYLRMNFANLISLMSKADKSFEFLLTQCKGKTLIEYLDERSMISIRQLAQTDTTGTSLGQWLMRTNPDVCYRIAMSNLSLIAKVEEYPEIDRESSYSSFQVVHDRIQNLQSLQSMPADDGSDCIPEQSPYFELLSAGSDGQKVFLQLFKQGTITCEDLITNCDAEGNLLLKKLADCAPEILASEDIDLTDEVKQAIRQYADPNSSGKTILHTLCSAKRSTPLRYNLNLLQKWGVTLTDLACDDSGTRPVYSLLEGDRPVYSNKDSLFEALARCFDTSLATVKEAMGEEVKEAVVEHKKSKRWPWTRAKVPGSRTH